MQVLLFTAHFDFDAEDAEDATDIGLFAVDTRHLAARKDFKTDLLGVRRTGVDVVAITLSVGIAASRPETAVDLADVRAEFHADLLEPFHTFPRAVRQGFDECWIGTIVACRKNLLNVKLWRVFNTRSFRIRLDDRIHTADRHHRIAAKESHLFKRDDLGAESLVHNVGGQTRANDDHFPGLVPLLRMTAQISGLGG